METQPEVTQMGLTHVLSHTSGLGLAPAILLLLMSVATWYWIVLKVFQHWKLSRHTRAFLAAFWACRTLKQVEDQLLKQAKAEPCAALMASGLQAARQVQNPEQGLVEMGSREEFVLRALRRSITRSTLQVESGLTLLASVGSAAPFVGLFGTVWGIYNALIGISISGQSTLDKVAGPVGEALIMTAFGLAVALPAVIAYNIFVRINRVYLAELDGFAHDVFALLTTGHAGAPAQPAAKLVARTAMPELQAGEM
jgi:biopolymer transport protein ExbB